MEDGLVVTEYTRNGNLQHSTQLMPAVEQVIQGSGWEPKEIDQIVIAKGPGSYTGVRIGATIAKTLAWTLKKPLVPVSSLKVMAANGALFQGLIVPLIDARRKNFYAGGYKMVDGELVEVIPDTHIASEAFFDQLEKEEGPILFVGQDLSIYQTRIIERFGAKAHFASQQDWLPRAGTLAALAKEHEPVDVHLFTPEYLKKTEAEENWQKGKEGERKGDYVERID